MLKDLIAYLVVFFGISAAIGGFVVWVAGSSESSKKFKAFYFQHGDRMAIGVGTFIVLVIAFFLIRGIRRGSIEKEAIANFSRHYSLIEGIGEVNGRKVSLGGRTTRDIHGKHTGSLTELRVEVRGAPSDLAISRQHVDEAFTEFADKIFSKFGARVDLELGHPDFDKKHRILTQDGASVKAWANQDRLRTLEVFLEPFGNVFYGGALSRQWSGSDHFDENDLEQAFRELNLTAKRLE